MIDIMATPSHRQRLIDPQNHNMQQQSSLPMNAFNLIGQDRQGGLSLNQPSSSGVRQPLSAMSSNINNIQSGNRLAFGLRKVINTGFNKGGNGGSRNGNSSGNYGYDGNMSSHSINLE